MNNEQQIKTVAITLQILKDALRYSLENEITVVDLDNLNDSIERYTQTLSLLTEGN